MGTAGAADHEASIRIRFGFWSSIRRARSRSSAVAASRETSGFSLPASMTLAASPRALSASPTPASRAGSQTSVSTPGNAPTNPRGAMPTIANAVLLMVRRPTDDGRIGAEVTAPEPIAHDDDGGRVGPILERTEIAAQARRHAQQREVPGGHELGGGRLLPFRTGHGNRSNLVTPSRRKTTRRGRAGIRTPRVSPSGTTDRRPSSGRCGRDRPRPSPPIGLSSTAFSTPNIVVFIAIARASDATAGKVSAGVRTSTRKA